jgi:hypothetical protein
VGGSARKEYQAPKTRPATPARSLVANQGRAWLISSEVAGWLANVAADIPDHALTTGQLTVTVEWK